MKTRFLSALFLGIAIFCAWQYFSILKEKHALKESLTNLERQNQELIEDLKQKISDNEKLTQEKNSLENELNSLKNNIAELEGDIAKLNKKLTYLKTENKFLIKERFSLKEKVTHNVEPKINVQSGQIESSSIREIKMAIKDLKRKLHQTKIELKKQKIREKRNLPAGRQERKVEVLPTP